MNLLVSYNWLKKYVGLKETPEEFAAKVSLSGPGVERLYPQGTLLDGIVVGHVLEVKTHPQADKLRLAIVDVGKKKLSIVCGGSNLVENQWVAVALIGAKVKWHGEGDLIELKPVEIRGVKSEGMICAASEIGLGDAFPTEEREIFDLEKAQIGEKLKAGAPLASFLGIEGDVVLDTEVTTNRPDAMSIVGIAREAATILKRPFLWKEPKLPVGANLSVRPGPGTRHPGQTHGSARTKLSVTIQDKKLCPRFMGVRIDGVMVGESPWWLKRCLISAGIRPINNLVDITNFILLELGRPMHVFDADKIKGDLQVRFAKTGESIKALDEKIYKLGIKHLVIADDQGAQSIAGIMGGEESGVTKQTKNIIFECATWDPVQIRRTGRELNLQSDSQALFEKGLSTESTPIGLARAIELCQELAGGQIASNIVDTQTGKYKPLSFSISFEEIDTLIGVKISNKEMLDTLKRLGFLLKVNSSKLTTIVPWWRDHDIESGRDLGEEIARVYGYANLPAVFPVGLATHTVSKELIWEDRVKQLAKGAGLTELYTYSFVSRELCEKAGYSVDRSLRVQNPLSNDFEFMRTSLLPSILQVVADNQERFREQQLFEVAHVYLPKDKDWRDLPDEQLELSAAFFGGNDVWRKAKGFAELVYQECGIKEVVWKRLVTDPFWHPGRSVQAFHGEHLLGTIGEVHPMIAQKFKLDGRVALINLPLEEAFALATSAKTYIPLPSYPEAKRDMALLVDRAVEVQALAEIMKSASTILHSVEWFDTYVGKGLPADKKSVAFHLVFRLDERTLETSEVDVAMKKIQEHLKKSFGAETR